MGRALTQEQVDEQLRSSVGHDAEQDTGFTGAFTATGADAEEQYAATSEEYPAANRARWISGKA